MRTLIYSFFLILFLLSAGYAMPYPARSRTETACVSTRAGGKATPVRAPARPFATVFKAYDDRYGAIIDGKVTVKADNGVLTNDSLGNQGPYTAELVGALVVKDGQGNTTLTTAQGKVRFQKDGSFTYARDPDDKHWIDPNNPAHTNDSPFDSFRYRVTDQGGHADEAQVIISFLDGNYASVGDADAPLGSDGCISLLKKGTGPQRGAVWYSVLDDLDGQDDTLDLEELDMLPFVVSFKVRFGSGMSGMAFVLHNSGANALGDAGSALGYEGITPFAAVEFDIKPGAADQITLRTSDQGLVGSAPMKMENAASVDVEDNQYHTVQIVRYKTYYPLRDSLKIFFDGQERLRLKTGFGSQDLAYWGFTGASESNPQGSMDICDINFFYSHFDYLDIDELFAISDILFVQEDAPLPESVNVLLNDWIPEGSKADYLGMLSYATHAAEETLIMDTADESGVGTYSYRPVANFSGLDIAEIDGHFSTFDDFYMDYVDTGILENTIVHIIVLPVNDAPSTLR